jgi:hypothetical protein
LRDFEVSIFFPYLPYLSNPHEISQLTRTDILLGDEEVEKFLKEKKAKNPNELFDVLRNPRFVKVRVEEHYDEKRGKLGEKLVISANELANTFREIKTLERSLMHTHFTRSWDQDGSDISHWEDSEQVYRYSDLKKKITSLCRAIDSQLEEGSKLYLIESMPLIDGATIGFPELTHFDDYSAWLKNSLIPNINVALEKIDSYLSEQQKKAEA